MEKEARGQVWTRGISIDEVKVESIDKQITLDDFKDGK